MTNPRKPLPLETVASRVAPHIVRVFEECGVVIQGSTPSLAWYYDRSLWREPPSRLVVQP